jgi:hypothetical protein
LSQLAAARTSVPSFSVVSRWYLFQAIPIQDGVVARFLVMDPPGFG